MAWPASARAGSTSGPSSTRGCRVAKGLDGLVQLLGRARVVDGHVGAVVDQEAREGDAAAGQAQHGHGLVAEGLRSQVAQVDGRGVRWVGHRRQLSSPMVAM